MFIPTYLEVTFMSLLPQKDMRMRQRNKMITTSGGGALICSNEEDANAIMWYATQARDAYPYYQHSAIGYNYRMSNVLTISMCRLCMRIC